MRTVQEITEDMAALAEKLKASDGRERGFVEREALQIELEAVMSLERSRAEAGSLRASGSVIAANSAAEENHRTSIVSRDADFESARAYRSDVLEEMRRHNTEMQKIYRQGFLDIAAAIRSLKVAR